MRHNRADNVGAFVEAVLASSALHERDKVHVLLADAEPGELLASARDAGASEAIDAYRAAVQSSTLPPVLQDVLLSGSTKRCRRS